MFSKIQFFDLKKFVSGQSLGSFISRRFHWISKLLVATEKLEVWKQMCVIFLLFQFWEELWRFKVKGMLLRNIEHFLEKRIWEKLGISELKWLKKNYFFLFPTVCIFYFCKNLNPSLYIYFGLINLWGK